MDKRIFKEYIETYKWYRVMPDMLHILRCRDLRLNDETYPAYPPKICSDITCVEASWQHHDSKGPANSMAGWQIFHEKLECCFNFVQESATELPWISNDRQNNNRCVKQFRGIGLSLTSGSVNFIPQLRARFVKIVIYESLMYQVIPSIGANKNIKAWDLTWLARAATFHGTVWAKTVISWLYHILLQS